MSVQKSVAVDRRPPSRAQVAQVVIATLVMVAALGVIWLIAVPAGPVVCPAIMPPPTNCITSHREGTAMVLSVLVVVIYLATLALAFTVRRRRPAFLTTGIVALGVILLVAWPAIGLLPGFRLSGS